MTNWKSQRAQMALWGTLVMLVGAGYALSSTLGIPVRGIGVPSQEGSIEVGLPVFFVGLIVLVYAVRKKDTTGGEKSPERKA